MVKSFRNKGTDDIYNGINSVEARRICPRNLWRIAFRKLDQPDAVVSLNDLQIPPGNRLEVMKADRIGQHSIRINSQYRICFRWTDSGPEDIEISRQAEIL